MMNNRDYLFELISEFSLDRREIAEMLKVKRETVDRWLLSISSSNHEDIPDMAIELLRLKLRDRAVGDSKAD